MIGYLTSNYALIHALSAQPVRRSKRSTQAIQRMFPNAPRLSDFFEEGEILGSKGPLDGPISGLAIDSRRVVPGNVFFALPGRRVNGAQFIDEAVNRGAVAVVTSALPVAAPAKVGFIRVADPRAMLARVARRYYRFPDRDLSVIAVAGSSGKTTVTHLIKHFLNGDQRIGMIGTIHYDLGARTVPSYRTTPESLDTFGLLAQMRDAGCRQAVMEVSSQGIDQDRVLGLQFGAAVFTNVTRDQLESRLFTGGTGCVPPIAVVNLDDACGEQMAARIAAEFPAVKVVTFGENPRAQVRAEAVMLEPANSSFRVVYPRMEGSKRVGDNALHLDSPLIGRFNVSNLLAAIATAWGLGRDPSVFLTRLRGFKGVPGRMERVEEGQPFSVVVDYAHTGDSLRNALSVLRPITAGRLMVVFGCGGNRDRDQRASMVKAVQEYADFAFATADNPRGEPLAQIFADMREGMSAPEKIAWVEDRRRALALALDGARPGDCLLVAGKGHESYQELADTVIPFDDRQVVRELIAVKAARQRDGRI